MSYIIFVAFYNDRLPMLKLPTNYCFIELFPRQS